MKKSRYLTVVCFAILAAGGAWGATWHVAPAPAGNDTSNNGLSWASPFATIQKGVNSAAASGDTVLVSNGTYTTSAEIGVAKAVTIQGLSTNARDTVVDGGGTSSSRVFNLSVAGSTLSGLTISNGYNNAYGAGVYMVSGALTNCVVTGNRWSGANNNRGAGVYMTGAGGLIVDCQIVRNGDPWQGNDQRGGGVYAMAGLIRDSTIAYNKVANGSYGGGVGMEGGRIENCVIANNLTAGANGCGIGIAGAVEVVCCVIRDNSGGSGGNNGAVFISSGAALISGCVVTNNHEGAGISVSGAGTMIETSTVVHNGRGAAAGGIIVNAACTVRGCLVIGNEKFFTSAGSGSAGIGVATGVAAVIENCTVSGNVIYSRDPGTLSGGVTLSSSSVMRNTIVHGNRYNDLNDPDPTYVGDLNVSGAVLSNSCAPELTHGVNGNITSAPRFLVVGTGQGYGQAGALFQSYDLRLVKSSPCIDAGQYQSWMDGAFDLNGVDRIRDDVVDMGAYEYPPFVATTWYVAPAPAGNDTSNNGLSWGSPFATIQKGVNAAAVCEDTVLVSNGVYVLSGEIGVAKAVTIRGLSTNARDTVVDGGNTGSSRVFNLIATGATLSGLTISNAYNDANGAGVYMVNGTLTNCVVTRNRWKSNGAQLGGGVYMTGADSLIVDCLIERNGEPDTAVGGTKRGSGVYATAGLIRDSKIAYNRGLQGYGTGVNMLGGRIENCEIVGNDKGGNGTGINIDGAVQVVGCVIHSNTQGGPAVQVSSGAALISGCVVSNHVEQKQGIYVNGAGTVIENTAVVHNGRYDTVGGLHINAACTVRSCLVAGNERYGAGTAGIGVSAGVAAVIENCTVSGNVVYSRDPGNCVSGVGLSSSSVMRNTIVHGNVYHSLSDPDPVYLGQLYVNGAAVSNNCAPELTHGFSGNITNAPRFVAAGTGYGSGSIGSRFAAYNLHLAKGSPCIDAGQYQTWMAAATDLDGTTRYNGTPVDMGAYEFPPPPGTIVIIR